MRPRQLVGFGAAALLAAAVAGCCGAEAQTAPSAARAAVERVERTVDGRAYAINLQRVESPDRGFQQRLLDATTVNVDGPGLTPVAAEAMPIRAAAAGSPAAADGQGLLLAASEPDATCSIDGFAPEKIGNGKPVDGGWYAHERRELATGVHSVRVAKEGYFPVETQVLVRPGVYDIVAVRLGKVVMRAAAPK
ncbi:MAG TPA: hypothetical protein VHF22_14390 [Planctomycetota bacterium]|nr:hypothetical protein [Planctomycetota bacterium]